jgi:hypothetical protein
VHLEKVKIKRIIGPTPSGAAVLLGNDVKTFVVFVGFYEAAALIREINQEVPARPLTHELIQNVFLGFDVEVKHVIISSILENTFCATLILEQKVGAGGEGAADGDEWRDRRNEVRIDARPSDCFVLALKNKVDVFVTKEVFEQVQDVSKMTDEVEGSLAAGAQLEGHTLGDIEFDLGSSEGDGDPSTNFLDAEDAGEGDDLHDDEE